MQSSNVFKLVKELDALTDAYHDVLDRMEALAIKRREALETKRKGAMAAVEKEEKEKKQQQQQQ